MQFTINFQVRFGREREEGGSQFQSFVLFLGAFETLFAAEELDFSRISILLAGFTLHFQSNKDRSYNSGIN